MNFCKGKIKNINKKLITGTLVFALTATLCGCTKDFNYSREIKNGKYSVVVTGDIDWKTASNLKLLQLKVLDKNVLFLARCYEKKINENNTKKIIYEYYDVFEDLKIIDLVEEKNQLSKKIEHQNDNVQFIKEEPLKDYLEEEKFKRKSYSVDELKEIYKIIEQNYEFEDTKKIIKGK